MAISRRMIVYVVAPFAVGLLAFGWHFLLQFPAFAYLVCFIMGFLGYLIGFEAYLWIRRLRTARRGMQRIRHSLRGRDIYDH